MNFGNAGEISALTVKLGYVPLTVATPVPVIETVLSGAVFLIVSPETAHQNISTRKKKDVEMLPKYSVHGWQNKKRVGFK